MLTFILIAAAAPLQAEPLPTVDLLCRGSGEATRMIKLTPAEKARTPDLNYRRQVDPFRGTIQISIRPGGATAELPAAMVGPYADRKMEIEKLKVSSERIDGKLPIALLYSPVLTLNRVTGAITVSGSQSNFSGECEPFNPASDRRF